MSSLVIVESPAKAKTLSRILGSGYVVEASYGHIRDLPEKADQIPAQVKKEAWARLGVNVEADFEPLYVVPQDKKRHIRRLKDALGKADEILLATDEDREGESISWHVLEVLAPQVPVRRIVFHEITDEAIHEALEHPREIDLNLVKAQETRRILDRLYGYQLSPVLWRKVRSGLSAGRVQSVAVRLCVERERERRRFKTAGYWEIEAAFEESGTPFTARLSRLGGRRIANSKDFVGETGEPKPRSRALWLRTRQQVDELIASWGSPWTVTGLEEKPLKRRPSPPFTTSTLQQEAYRKLRFTARHTMRVAQRLYEGIDLNGDRVGLITYMRTDSFTLSRKALGDAQRLIRGRWGDEFTQGPRYYKTKSKLAQEAHEAIRPSEISRAPDQVGRFLSDDEQRLYELIWKRTVASQMADAQLSRTTLEITAPAADGNDGLFVASGTVVRFPGFLRVYREGTDAPAKENGDQEVELPKLDEQTRCEPQSIDPRERRTSPPARYTEATLVKKLEAEGIGRPSTYASIIDTIQDRGYIVKQQGALVPTYTAHAVTQLLESHFEEYVDTGFTARMEQSLDDIAGGNLPWLEHLRAFYLGDDTDGPGLEQRIASAVPNIEYPAMEIGHHPESGKPIVVRIGRYGPYLQQAGDDGEKLMASLPGDLAPADLTLEVAVDLLEKARQGARLVGHDADSGEPVYLAHGRFGAYVQLGETPERGSRGAKPKRASVPKSITDDDVTLDKALTWLSLPRTLGKHPESEDEVLAASGRFGPYIKCGTETRSLTADDDVYTVALERALELLAQPKGRRGRRRAARQVLKELGPDAKGKPLQVIEGPYGPYLTNGELNASLPKGTNHDSLTSETAIDILSSRGKKPGGRRRSKARK